MPTAEVSAVLSSYGLLSPDLEMLRPTSKRYNAFLMQPSGPIQATTNRIGPLDSGLAAAKGKSFLNRANEKNAHLAITPEYFFPWTELRALILDGVQPCEDALWVLGAESITDEVLERFKIDVADFCLVHFESLESLPLDRTLLDPVVLMFHARRPDETTQLVAIVQFKTHHSRDNLFLEEALLKRGTAIYKFRGLTGNLSTAAIICSDSFGINIPWLYDFNNLSTLIHIQLNPNPRQSAYRHYRTSTFLQDARSTSCHIVSLNWAHSIIQHGEGLPPDEWRNVSGSTWYCPFDECSTEDEVVLPNHNLGLYYAFMKERRHALMFHYDEAVFELLVPKLQTLEHAVLANRNGPIAIRRFEWSEDDRVWNPTTSTPNSGLEKLLDTNNEAKIALDKVIKTKNPLSLERVLALSCGSISGSPTWFFTEYVDSCQIDIAELFKRITVVQDDEEVDFKSQRLDVAAQIQHIISSPIDWPPQVKGLSPEATINWDKAAPHFNVLSVDGLPTLVVFLGERPSVKTIENKIALCFDLLRKWGGVHQHRFCLAYREFGQIKFASISALTAIDDPLLDQTDLMSVPALELDGGLNG